MLDFLLKDSANLSKRQVGLSETDDKKESEEIKREKERVDTCRTKRGGKKGRDEPKTARGE